MMLEQQFTDGVFLVDFEFHPEAGQEGNKPLPVCMVVRQWPLGLTNRYWRNELQKMNKAPFPTGKKALFVAYFASAELDCFDALGWQPPDNVLDLYAEFRWLTNGQSLAHGQSLLGALIYFGLSSICAEEKDSMRDLILSEGPWSDDEQGRILDYCLSDVIALSDLLNAMEELIDLSRGLLRGQYMKCVSSMQSLGIPIDKEVFTVLKNQWGDIQDHLIAEIDSQYGVYEGRSFKTAKWEEYLCKRGIPWPRLPSGRLDMSDDTFKQMANAYPEISPIRELRSSLSVLRLSKLQIGSDGRNRCLMSPFRSSTGRNQPSNSKFIFGPSVWFRSLIKPKEGFAVAYVDWSQQEFGIAAALSKDSAMMEAYRSGDPYLAFAIQAGAAPLGATKSSHEAVRDQFKQCVLAVQYGMGAEGLAGRINQPVARARQLLELHRRTYKQFWRWSDSIVDEAVLGGRLWASFGWQINTREQFNDRSLRNFPMQANGSEMLRIACILLSEAGVKVCATIHDAILIEAPLEEIDSTVIKTQELMKQASGIVLDGFELGSDAKIVRYPERYSDKRGKVMWDVVMKIIKRDTPN